MNGFGRRMGYRPGAGFGFRMGYRPGAGFGFRGISPPWPYIGRGRGGLPRCRYPYAAYGPDYMSTSYYTSQMPLEQDLDYLRRKAEAIKRELAQVESQIQNLEK